jgi:glutamine cyclotransferase
MAKRVVAFVLLLSVYGCNDNPERGNEQSPPPIPVINYAVVKTFPHDTTSFTEGFLVHNGQLLESSGSPSDLPQTRSLVGFADTATGKMNIKIELDSRKYFGEGIVVVKDKLYLLTYKSQTCFVYDAKSFKPIGQFRFANKEGWGLTTNGSEIIMSDGTDQLTFINPDNFTPIRQVRVTENGVSRNYINELEFINGFIYANIWQQDVIVKIDPATGNIAGRLDISTLANEARGKQPDADASNGIAWDSATDRIYITGKLWPAIYEVKFPY